jgi:hypothetical protein
MSPQYCATKIASVVATASSELRTTSEQTTEIMKRMLVARCTTTELVAWSKAAIASSRCLLKTTGQAPAPVVDTATTALTDVTARTGSEP